MCCTLMVEAVGVRALAWFEIWSSPLVLEERGASMYNDGEDSKMERRAD